MPLYIAKSGDLEGCHACLTDSQRKDRATQLLIKYKSGALVTQIMFGHQSPVPRNNTASYQFPLRKLYNLRSLSWWNLFFWASFLNMDVCDHWIWSLVQIDANFIGKEITFCGLYLLSISPKLAHVRTLLAINESKFPPPWLTSPPPLWALRPPQWERPLYLTNVSSRVYYAPQ